MAFCPSHQPAAPPSVRADDLRLQPLPASKPRWRTSSSPGSSSPAPSLAAAASASPEPRPLHHLRRPRPLLRSLGPEHPCLAPVEPRQVPRRPLGAALFWFAKCRTETSSSSSTRNSKSQDCRGRVTRLRPLRFVYTASSLNDRDVPAHEHFGFARPGPTSTTTSVDRQVPLRVDASSSSTTCVQLPSPRPDRQVPRQRVYHYRRPSKTPWTSSSSP